MERLGAPEPQPDAVAVVLEGVLEEESATLSGSWQRWLRSTPRGTTSGRRISRSSARFATSSILSACA